VLSADQADEIVTLEEIERRYIARVITLVDGNKSRAAQLLGLDRRTLYRKLERYEQQANAAASGASGASEPPSAWESTT
jgi:two-component system response regulator HydG